MFQTAESSPQQTYFLCFGNVSYKIQSDLGDYRAFLLLTLYNKKGASTQPGWKIPLALGFFHSV